LINKQSTLYDLKVGTEPGIWRQPPSDLTLSESEVHLWKSRIADYEADAELFYSGSLPTDEKEKADNIRSQENRKAYIISRGILRTILSEYLKVEPGDIVFEYNEHGKPSIADGLNPRNVRFNLSHSNDLILYAVAKNKEVGVDIEYMREISKAGRIVERFFSPEQRDFYNSQSESTKKTAFFRLWTRREAYGKAMGRGFSVPAADCGIPLMRNDGEPASVHVVSGKWSIYDLEQDDNYVSAVTVEGQIRRIECFRPRNPNREANSS
jgi:4'-phosphopantetheinyl transferase